MTDAKYNPYWVFSAVQSNDVKSLGDNPVEESVTCLEHSPLDLAVEMSKISTINFLLKKGYVKGRPLRLLLSLIRSRATNLAGETFDAIFDVLYESKLFNTQPYAGSTLEKMVADRGTPYMKKRVTSATLIPDA